MSKEYFEALQYYYENQEKFNFKGVKQICDKCKKEKQFIVEPGSLTYKCSSTCKDSIKITLSRYLYYPEMIMDMRRYLDNYFDKSNLKEIFSTKDIKEQEIDINNHKEVLQKLHSDFVENNNMASRKTIIKKTYHNRIQLKKEQNILMNKLSNEENTSKLTELRKNYLQLNQKMIDQTNQLLESNKPLNNFIVVEKGSVKKA